MAKSVPKFRIGQKVLILPCAEEVNIRECSIGRVGTVSRFHGDDNSYDVDVTCGICSKSYIHNWWAREQDLRACVTKGQQLYLWEIIGV